jgi:hypothetical protein
MVRKIYVGSWRTGSRVERRVWRDVSPMEFDDLDAMVVILSSVD